MIGLGQIGMGYDYECNDGSFVLTHASAFHSHPAFELVAGVDPDPGKRQMFTRKFGVVAFATIDEMYLQCKPEIVALAVPTHAHFDTFRQILPFKPVSIICEKPISHSLKEAQEIVDHVKKSGIALLVNYIRRFDPGVHRLKDMISSGALGKIYKGVVWYSKGIAHNGSHFINLMEFFFGAAEEIKLVNPGQMTTQDDGEPDVLIRFGEVEIFFLAGREECFSIASIELIGTKGKILCTSGGEVIENWRAEPDAVYPGYVSLSAIPERIETAMNRYQWNVVDGLSNYLSGISAELASDGEAALKTMNVIHEIRMLMNIL